MEISTSAITMSGLSRASALPSTAAMGDARSEGDGGLAAAVATSPWLGGAGQ